MSHRITVLRNHLFPNGPYDELKLAINNTSSRKWNEEPDEKEKVLKSAKFATKTVHKGNISSLGFRTALSVPIVARFVIFLKI
jgi:hypothetical protein